MPGLMDSLGETLTPQTLGTIGKRIGVSEDTMRKGMDAAAPAVLGSLSKSAATPAGLDDIMAQMSSMQSNAQGGDVMGSVLGGLMGGGGGLGGLLGGLLGGQSAHSGTAADGDVLGGMMGPATGAISGTLSKKLGFDVGPILTMAVPLILGMLSKQATANNLDKQGVANLLQSESQAYMAKGGETAALVQSALDAGDKATALKNSMGADWTKVRVAPLAIAKLLIDSSKSGPVGTFKELGAAAETVIMAAKDADPVSLISVAFSSDPQKGELDEVTTVTSKEGLLALVGDAMSAVNTHQPSQAAAFRALMLDIANKTAGASKEGGFLGVGGTTVNAAEQTTINEITKVLA